MQLQQDPDQILDCALDALSNAADWRAVLDAHLRIYRETAAAADGGGPRHLYLVGTPRSGHDVGRLRDTLPRF